MRKHLNTRSMIFTLYGDYVRHYGNEIWIGSLIRLLKPFGHNEQSVRAAMSRMNKQGWVVARKEGNKSFYSLTERGVKRMDEAAHRIFKLQPEQWDGKWRMVMYNIPEDKRQFRDELRKELVWSGFGLLASSLWVTPNGLEKQVEDIIAKYDVNHYVNLFLAENKGPKDNQAIVSSCWDIDDINDKYNQFIKTYSEKYVVDKNKIDKGQMTTKDCFVERTMLVHEYRKFLFIDPGLPQELLPDQWLGEHAASLFRDYYRTLAKPASDFFDNQFFIDNNHASKSRTHDVLDHPLIID